MLNRLQAKSPTDDRFLKGQFEAKANLGIFVLTVPAELKPLDFPSETRTVFIKLKILFPAMPYDRRSAGMVTLGRKK